MKVFVTQNTLKTGKIVETEGSVLTGHDNQIRVKGFGKRNHIISKPYWHTSLKEAEKTLRERAAQDLQWAERNYNQAKAYLEGLKKISENLPDSPFEVENLLELKKDA